MHKKGIDRPIKNCLKFKTFILKWPNDTENMYPVWVGLNFFVFYPLLNKKWCYHYMEGLYNGAGLKT